jgi:hypothetical protein
VHVVICGEVGAEEILETDLVWTTTRLADHNTHLCLERQHIHMIAHEVFLLQPLDMPFIHSSYHVTMILQHYLKHLRWRKRRCIMGFYSFIPLRQTI